jgi:branched-chain amino acid transport system permease protein
VLFAAKARSHTGVPTAAVLIVLAVVPGAGPSGRMLAALSLGLIYALATVGLDVYSGYGGLLSFGNFAFVAVGAYTSAILATTYHWNYWATLPAAMIVCGLCSVVLGVAMVRLPDLGAAFVTFFFGFLVVIMLEGSTLDRITHGENGIAVPPLAVGRTTLTAGRGLYYLALLLVAAVALPSLRYVNCRAGRVLRVVKRSDVVAASLGIRVSSARLSAFVYSAVCAGVAGFVFAASLGYLAPETFDYTLSIELVVALVVGGIGSIGGAVVGAVVLQLVAEATRSAGQLSQVINALLLIVFIVLLPRGIYGVVETAGARLLQTLRRRSRHHSGSARGDRPSGERDAGFDTAELSPMAAAAVAGSPRPAELLVDALAVDFGGIHALRNVTLDVACGEVLGVMGPNGAGKTTLLNCISGIQRYQGTVLLAGRPISGLTSRAIRTAGVARTFQNPSLVPDLTVLENVELGAYGLSPASPIRDLLPTPGVLRRDRVARELAHQALDLIGIPEATRHRLAADISLAEQKMTDLARAIAGRPALLMLDEPTAGMDEDGMSALRDALLRVSRETSMTMIIIAHHIGFLRMVADRVVVLDFGQVLAVGTSDEVLERDDVVEAFVGSARRD